MKEERPVYYGLNKQGEALIFPKKKQEDKGTITGWIVVILSVAATLILGFWQYK